MIPFFQLPALQLGPVAIQSFGVLAAAGIYLAARIIERQAIRQGLPVRPFIDFIPWGVAAGVVVGHLVHLFFYHPEELHGPWGAWQILKVWDGLSSMGGVLGGVLAAFAYFRWRRLHLSQFADALALGVAPGWAVARLGCFTVHDHPGVRTDFVLAVAFPGGARHDLGLYDALLLLAITTVLYAAARRHLFEGRLLALLALLYGGGRFALDFLRARDLPYVDGRYLGLTPAQYGAALLLLWGLYALVLHRRSVSQRRDGQSVGLSPFAAQQSG
jgi:phosphatidylglycerol:prolipoprotein diacylglycerol transferase